jgi:hypothetical protein
VYASLSLGPFADNAGVAAVAEEELVVRDFRLLGCLVWCKLPYVLTIANMNECTFALCCTLAVLSYFDYSFTKVWFSTSQLD